MTVRKVLRKIIKNGETYEIETGSSITVDSSLSDSSENPVQNKVVKGAIDGKITNPSGGTAGQFLKKTANGEEWDTVVSGDPIYEMTQAEYNNLPNTKLTDGVWRMIYES